MKLYKPLDQTDIDYLVNAFKTHLNGRKNAAKTDKLKIRLKITYSPQQLRKIIGHIRKNDLATGGFIVSSVHEGYWYTEDIKEQENFLAQELNRMSNQFSNVEMLHVRLKDSKPKIQTKQQSIFN